MSVSQTRIAQERFLGLHVRDLLIGLMGVKRKAVFPVHVPEEMPSWKAARQFMEELPLMPELEQHTRGFRSLVRKKIVRDEVLARVWSDTWQRMVVEEVLDT